MSAAADIAWLAADWGTSHLRLWALDAADRVLWERRSDDGMGRLARADYEPALLRLIGADLPAEGRLPVIVCGMAGSRQGWAEAPYAAAPCAPPGIESATRVATDDPRLDVRILPGVKQELPPDVMRGEETQIAGYLAGDPRFDGVLCLPGTHCKWVRISAGEIVSFQTFMTGELFALLATASVLRHSVAAEGWEEPPFLEAVDEAISRPAGIAARLFRIRAESLLNKPAPVTARSRLSGYLIGLELAAARPYWLGQRTGVLGARGVATAYAEALAAQGVPVERHDAGDLTLAGLRAARAALPERAA